MTFTFITTAHVTSEKNWMTSLLWTPRPPPLALGVMDSTLWRKDVTAAGSDGASYYKNKQFHQGNHIPIYRVSHLVADWVLLTWICNVPPS